MPPYGPNNPHPLSTRKTVQRLDKMTPADPKTPVAIQFPEDWLELNVLRREAEKLIKPEAGR